MKRTRFLTLLTLVLALSLVFCSCGARTNTSISLDKGADIYYSTGGTKNESMSYDSDYATSEDTVNVENDLASRKIIKNAEMTVQTKTFDAFVEELNKKINSLGGYVQSSSVHGNSYSASGNRSAQYTVRIPAESLEEFKNGVSSLGNVTYYNESVKDVTTSYVDTESRIKALETEQTTLLELLTKSENLDAILKVQERLSEVNYQLESYKSQLRTYDSLISYSTIKIDVCEVERVTTIPSKQTLWQRISNDFGNNIKDILTGAGDIFVWLVGSVPYLVLLAIPTVVIIVLIRHNIKKRKKKITPPQNTNE